VNDYKGGRRCNQLSISFEGPRHRERAARRTSMMRDSRPFHMHRCALGFLLLMVGVGGCDVSTSRTVPTETPRAKATVQVSGTVQSAGGCGQTPLNSGSLPSWMLSASQQSSTTGIPYVVADPPTAGGIVFGFPLRAGSPSGRSNKVLWIVRKIRGGFPLQINGHLLSASSRAVQLTVPADSGPGEIYPSVIDVPTAGCWHFELQWGENQASVDLLYSAP